MRLPEVGILPVYMSVSAKPVLLAASVTSRRNVYLFPKGRRDPRPSTRETWFAGDDLLLVYSGGLVPGYPLLLGGMMTYVSGDV